jgi:hypothetical protein
MLMVRRKRNHWIHCVHEKSGEVLSLQIRDVVRGPAGDQITVAIRDAPRNYRILRPGDRVPAAAGPPE